MITTYEAESYDVIVIGAGHAGSEAALATARMGCSTLLLTINLDSVAFMPCNPSVGGPAKGHVVREIDALGGEMGKNTDKTHIQMRLLNTGKGPAVHALRAQADKFAYQHEMKKTIENTPNLILRQAMVEELIINNGVCEGVVTQTGARYTAKAVVLTTGTYLRGKIILGDLQYESGPNNMRPSVRLAYHLKELGFEMVRFKTGTPPRVHKSSVDYSQMEIQPGDDVPRAFSYETTEFIMDQLPCWLTYTNENTHHLINDNLHRAPMYSGTIEGRGPRYCPSIEDKIVRFNDKPRHQIFLEPEGRNTEEMYVQGLSTSMPEEIQIQMLRSLPGMEQVRMMRPGYAIEYDALVPTQLWPTLETKQIPGLFTAGQINGTSGYEEAAAQGLMAGINAARKIQGKSPVILGREEAYIGVLIDDLVTKGTSEPYRLLTSRAEHRLLLRHDNADLRLTDIGFEIGLISEERYQRFSEKRELIEKEKERIMQTRVRPDMQQVQEVLRQAGSPELTEVIDLAQLLRRPEITYQHIVQMMPPSEALPEDVTEQVEIQIKYDGYIRKSLQQVERMKKMEERRIPESLDYHQISGMSKESRENLSKIRPLNIGQASRISGVNPADISVLMVYLEHYHHKAGAAAAE
ncbi:tRNA uridine-5-carboxymethylaminomethyl(34) synthesis enzyme MnmG [Brevibacillus ruminantium]|uniref:tRNA uridine 5-carboxymethylaminomethyl modification enzyme MnmG n=1 Tax=Brevibacillus ruminantium TaxID=2950604 RepID=A0ABY4WFF5_9BACL|nr:tRNA uridine-5-carboxymethylaminomethyl(34) synthesis enzyme MnmG [Brevibacillus ruminantium]USG65797.1 tRNA uridine-5-carboxymethylaminomethyl(34) synthesis enzyme MnmG [Brevibacillus ruminantium]